MKHFFPSWESLFYRANLLFLLITFLYALNIPNKPLNTKDLCSCDRYNDSLELVQFYEATNGTYWVNNWNFHLPMSTWHGVTLDDKDGGCVVKLSFIFNNLSGQLPDMQLPALTELILIGNHLDGTLLDFSGLTSLEYMHMTKNELYGQIPNFTNLPELKSLWLDENYFTDTIPDFKYIPKLEFLNLHLNQLTGSIPDFSNIPQLLSTYLYSNQLTGPIPNFSNLPKVQIMGIGLNQLSGTIPHFTGLESIRFLLLDHNQLQDSIPNFSNLPTLEQVNLDNNRFSFCSDLSQHPSLQVVKLNGNKLSFDDIIPNVFMSIYHSQDSLYQTKNVMMEIGDTYNFDLNIDHEISNNVYQWYKNDELFFEGDYCQFQLADLSPADNGIYYAKIINPDAPDLTLHIRPLTIHVTEAPFENCDQSTIQVNNLLQDHYQATHTIFSQANINEALSIQLKAGKEVILESGFEVEMGGILEVEIEECEE